MENRKWEKRFVLGITGSMGGGKSAATGIFESLGAYRISADEIARFFTSIDSPIRKELVELLGKKILNENGEMDRKRIAGIVFSDKNAITKFNALVHPLIREKTIALIQSIEDGRIIAWEAPLLFEAKGESLCDATVTVWASYEDSWNRVQKRDEISEEEFQRRLANQMDIKEKLKASDFKLINDKGLDHLREECMFIYNAIMNLKLS